MENIDRYHTERVLSDDSEMFESMFIGILAAITPERTWQDAITRTQEMLEQWKKDMAIK